LFLALEPSFHSPSINYALPSMEKMMAAIYQKERG